jgi:predicted transcriptional regulator
MPKSGRPPKPATEKTVSQTSVRLTADEKQQLDELESELESTSAEVIRLAIAQLYQRTFGRRGKAQRTVA